MLLRSCALVCPGQFLENVWPIEHVTPPDKLINLS